jgi:DNA-binding NarL/FixJ family response regulator
LAAIRQTGNQTPFILCTGVDSDEIVDTAHRLGAIAVLVKPIDLMVLDETIRRGVGMGEADICASGVRE